MTNEEAIRILARDTSLEAVNELKYYAGFCSDKVIEQIQEAMDMGAEALKKQSRIVEQLEDKAKSYQEYYPEDYIFELSDMVELFEEAIEIVKAGGTE